MSSEDFRGYLGSSTIKRSNVPIEWTPERIEEFMKCRDDPLYFARNYVYVVNVDEGKILIDPYDYQEEIVRAVQENRRVVAELARQSGKTTAIVIFVIWYIIFHNDKVVAILANKADTAREILGRVQLAYELLPAWLQQGVVEWNKGSFELENGSKVLAGTTSSSSIRGRSINVLVVDECAHIPNFPDFYASVFPTISSGKTTKVVLISTVNGLNHFYTITSRARRGENDYKLISVPWNRVPGRDEKWRQETLAGMNYDYEKFAQEFENQYLGSSGTLIAGWKLKELVGQVPMHESEGVRQYEEPREGRLYVGVADTSRGKGMDYSALQILDVTEMPYRQVCTFHDNMSTTADFASAVNRLGKLYNNAGLLVELNDMGQAVADTLYHDFEYENMFFTESAGSKGKKVTQAYGSQGKTTEYGVTTSKTVKSVGCSMMKLLIEQNQLLINDTETIEELSRFSKKGNSYEAEEGYHDDLVMCLVLFAWLSDQQLFKEMTDINTLMQLRERTEDQMVESLTPFGFIDDGTREIDEDVLQSGDKFDKREHWEVVSEDFLGTGGGDYGDFLW